MSPGIALFLLLVAMPIAEVVTFIQIGGWIGMLPTVLCVLATAALGTFIIRLQGRGLIQNVQQQLNAGSLPAYELFSGVCLLVAGALLLTPGFITDGLGFVLLWPKARHLIFAQAKKNAHTMNMKQHRDQPSPEPPAADIIDVEFEELDDTRDMPPPGRGWGGRPK